MSLLFQADRSRERVQQVLRTDFRPFPVTDFQRRLLQLLDNRVGQDRAISVGDLAERLRSNPRSVKEAVRSLRLKPFRVPIGSSRATEGGGYFLCATDAERIETAQQYSRQAFSELQVWRDMLEPHEIAEHWGQLHLQLNAGESA